MVNTTVPVISGGKNLRMLLTNIPTTTATIPPTIIAPTIALTPPPSLAMACILGRYAKLIPKIIGRPAPNTPFFKGKSWKKVQIADMVKDA